MRNRTTREQLAEKLKELMPEYASADHLREIEAVLQDLIDDFGPHPLVTAALKKLSSRIVALEIGNS